jgi:predicted DNA-binding protein (MmcQ/YjbR family)
MQVDEYNGFCRSLPLTSHVVQWGGAHVWKIAGKVFAIGRWDEDDGEVHVTFKTSELSFDLLKEQPGCRPAPYLASRGMKWIQRMRPDSMDDDALRDYIAESYRLVARGLPKGTRDALELDVDPLPLSKPEAGRSRQAMRTHRSARP